MIDERISPDSSESAPEVLDPDKDKDKVFLYRGVNQPHNKERIGKWWSTDPYYALRYSNAGAGSMFVVKIDKELLPTLAKDASIDEDYENYLFPQDPPNARVVTQEEIKQLEEKATYTKGLIGGEMIKPPDNKIEVGRQIFAEKPPKQ